MNLLELINNEPVFSDASNRVKTSIKDLAISRVYSEGERIVHQGDIWSYLFLIEVGSIKAIKESWEGRSLIVARFSSGDIFWGSAFFIEDIPMPAALVASENTKIHCWSRGRLLPIILANGKMSWHLAQLMFQRTLLASDIVNGLAFQPVAGRLANFLMNRFMGVEGEKVSRDLTLEEMAAYIGSTQEMVCRILHKFADQGFIEITRTEFSFTDREGLRQLAQLNFDV
jgi:CRP/FNR family transcriptional regulator